MSITDTLFLVKEEDVDPILNNLIVIIRKIRL